MIKIIRAKDVGDRTILSSPKPTDDVADKVTAILEDVRQRGDAALLEYKIGRASCRERVYSGV